MLLVLFTGLMQSSISSCGGEDEPAPVVPAPVPGGDDGEDDGGGDDYPSGPSDGSSEYMVIASVMETTRYPDGRIIENQLLSNPVYETAQWLGKTVLTSYESYSDWSYTYDFPNKAVMKSGSAVCTYKLDYDYATDFTSRDEDGTFQYDNKGRMTVATISYGSQTSEDRYTYDRAYNVVRYERVTNGHSGLGCDISYTDINAKCAPLQWLVGSGDWSSVLRPWAFYEAGIFRNSLPSKLVDAISQDDGVEIEYDYRLNDNGYVTRMVEHKFMSSGTYITTYDIKWRKTSIPSFSNWLFNDEGSPYYRILNQ